MRKSDINCVLDTTFEPEYGVRESLPVRYLIASRNGFYEVFETGDLRYFDPDIFSCGLYPTGDASPTEFLDWFLSA